MISVEEARKWVLEKTFRLDEEWLPLTGACNRVLSQDVTAASDLPPFRNSAMDGYALRKEDLQKGLRKFSVEGEIQAGKTNQLILKEGNAYRIFTGAQLPANADIVIIQENTDRGEGEVVVTTFRDSEASNIREAGEQLKKGNLALSAGHRLNPASIGLLASMGIHEVAVTRLPAVGILTTGNELRRPGEQLEAGEIYESNSFTLKAALRAYGINTVTEKFVEDNIKDTVESISLLLESCEVLILSGGISAGKYDHVKEALEKNNIEEVFHKVNQKPGKPMYFGVRAEKLVFALPGNPASLLVCFYEYVAPSILKLSGRSDLHKVYFRKLSSELNFGGIRPEFFRARSDENEVEILGGQSSSMLKSFAEANCFAYISGEKRKLSPGTMIECHPIFSELS